MNQIKLFSCIAIWLFGIMSHAALEPNKHFRFGSGDLRRIGHFSFLCPNELNPTKQIAIIEQAPLGGVYLSVGTERGFFALGLAGYRFQQVILADHDPAVIYFNEINIALIEASQTLQDYLLLRLSKNVNEFQSNLSKVAYQPKPTLDLNAKEHGRWFTERMRNYKKEFIEACSSGSLGEVYFQSEDHYQQLRSMILEGRVVTRFLELNRANPFGKIENELEQAGLEISVLDLSNAWWKRYLKGRSRKFILGPRQFHKDGIVIVTDKDLDQDFSKNKALALNWVYYGFHRAQLLELLDEEIGARSLERLFIQEGCLLSYFDDLENQLIDLNSWLPVVDDKLFLDQPMVEQSQEGNKDRRDSGCLMGLFDRCWPSRG